MRAKAYPEYNPIIVPFETLTIGRTPHPQFGVLNTCSGTFRGFCATRVRHVALQEQFYFIDENTATSLKS